LPSSCRRFSVALEEPVKTTVERVDDTTVKLSVTVEADRVGHAIDEAATRLSTQVKVPGFRPGRVPRRVLETRLGKEALVQEAVRDALPQFYAEAASSEQLDVVGPPDFDLDTFEDGKDAEFSATVEVRPEFEVPDYQGLQIAHPEWEVTDDDISDQLDALRDRFAELETVERAVEQGDYVVVTVVGERDGERLDEVSAEDLLYQVPVLAEDEESESALDRNLDGASAGDVLTFSDTLGPDYGELAGAEVELTATVSEVKSKALPELDDDFAITASEFDTIDELRAELRTQLAEHKLAQARAELRGKVVEEVCDLVDVPLPQSMVQQELRFRLNRLAQQAEQYGMSLEQYFAAVGTSPQDAVTELEAEARKTVKAQLVVDAVGRAAEVDVTQEDLGAEIARQSMRVGRPPEELAEFMTHPDRIGALVSDAFRRKAIDHLVDSVAVLSAPPDDDESHLEVDDSGAGSASEAVVAEADQAVAEAEAEADEATE
jgi:trigger factor